MRAALRLSTRKAGTKSRLLPGHEPAPAKLAVMETGGPSRPPSDGRRGRDPTALSKSRGDSHVGCLAAASIVARSTTRCCSQRQSTESAPAAAGPLRARHLRALRFGGGFRPSCAASAGVGEACLSSKSLTMQSSCRVTRVISPRSPPAVAIKHKLKHPLWAGMI